MPEKRLRILEFSSLDENNVSASLNNNSVMIPVQINSGNKATEKENEKKQRGTLYYKFLEFMHGSACIYNSILIFVCCIYNCPTFIGFYSELFT